MSLSLNDFHELPSGIVIPIEKPQCWKHTDVVGGRDCSITPKPRHKITATLRDTVTGRVTEYETDGPSEWSAHSALFYWTEDNFGCDCNRSDCMGEDFPELPCNTGENRIVLDKLLFDGEELDISE